MSLLKVSDNYGASIVGNFDANATTLTVDTAPIKTAGYLTVFDLNGNQFEKIKYTGVSGLNLTGCIRGLSFDDNSDTPVVGLAKELKNGMTIKMTVSQHYLNPVIDFVNQYDGKWGGAVADYAALSAITGEDGEVRVTLDDSKIYVYDTSDSSWHLAGAGGGAGTVYITTKLGTEAEGDDNKTFQLNSGSFTDKKYLQVYKNGVLQIEGIGNDYVATGSNQAVFEDVVADEDIITLLVVSVDLYNPAWNNVTGDVLPDLDNTYDIGSSSKQFKDGYFAGTMAANSFSGSGTNLTGVVLSGGTGANATAIGSSLDTVYQNNTTKPRLVLASIYSACGATTMTNTITVAIGETSSPTTTILVATNGNQSGNQATFPLSFIVPAGYYYKITKSSTSMANATFSVTNWFEFDLI